MCHSKVHRGFGLEIDLSLSTVHTLEGGGGMQIHSYLKIILEGGSGICNAHCNEYRIKHSLVVIAHVKG